MEDIFVRAEEAHCCYCGKVTIQILRIERNGERVCYRCSECGRLPQDQVARQRLSPYGQRRLFGRVPPGPSVPPVEAT